MRARFAGATTSGLSSPQLFALQEIDRSDSRGPVTNLGWLAALPRDECSSGLLLCCWVQRFGDHLNIGVGAIQQVTSSKLGSEKAKFAHRMLVRVGKDRM